MGSAPERHAAGTRPPDRPGEGPRSPRGLAREVTGVSDPGRGVRCDRLGAFLLVLLPSGPASLPPMGVSPR